MNPSRICCHVLVLVLAVCSAGWAQTAVTAQDNGTLRVETTSPNPIVFEVGKLGLPWRTIYDTQMEEHAVVWTGTKGRDYEVWDREAYARAQLRTIGEDPGRVQQRGRSLAGMVVDAIRLVQRRRASTDSDRLAQTEAGLSRALCALLEVRIDVQVGTDLKVRPEADLPFSVSFTCPDTQARARYTGLLKPDNWSLKPANAGSTKTSARGTLRIPARSALYPGNYPLTACYEIEFGRIKFRAVETVEAQLVHPLQQAAPD